MSNKRRITHVKKINSETRTTDKESARNAHSRLNRVRASEFRQEMRDNGYYR